jgi:hypothetical protein
LRSHKEKVKKASVIFVFSVLVFFAPIKAQKLQFGIKGTLATTVLISSAGSYDGSLFKRLPGITAGLGVAGNYYLDKKFRYTITTGIQLQVKTYSYRLYNFNIANVTGRVTYRPVFLSPEVPLIFGFEKKRKKKDDRYINFQLGAVFCYNIPFTINASQKGPFLENPENDTLISSFDASSNNLKTFSPDIYLGICWVKKVKKRRVSEWGISLQYAIKNSATYYFSGEVLTARGGKKYSAFFSEKLSYIAIHYTIYPKGWISK